MKRRQRRVDVTLQDRESAAADLGDTLVASDEEAPSFDETKSGSELPVDGAAADEAIDARAPVVSRWRITGGTSWTRFLVFAVLPGCAIVLTIAMAWMKWQDSSLRAAQPTGSQAVQAAREGTVALLSYNPGSVDRELGAAQDRLTGSFRNSYTQLTQAVVIPGAKQKQISTVANVPAAALVSINGHHAQVLLCVNQTMTIGNGAPTSTASSVRVSLDKVNDRWLIAAFEPI